MSGKANLVKCVISFVSVCFPLLAPLAKAHTFASPWIFLPLVDPEKKDTFKGPLFMAEK